MDDKERNRVIEDLFFTEEAARYLNITAEKFQGLIKDGRIRPVKQNKDTGLFYKEDLQQLAAELQKVKTVRPQTESKGTGNKSAISAHSLDKHTQTAVNYYVLQSFYNFSDEETEPIFRAAAEKVNMASETDRLAKELLNFISEENAAEADVTARGKRILRAFQTLEKSDLVVGRDMEEYPQQLREAKDAPPFLFMRGNPDLLRENIVTITADEGAGPQAKERAGAFAEFLGRAGLLLACGMDSDMEKAALEHSYKPILVTDGPLPEADENNELLQKIGKTGLILSPVPPSTGQLIKKTAVKEQLLQRLSLAEVTIGELTEGGEEQLRPLIDKAEAMDTDRQQTAGTFSKGIEVQYVYNAK